MADIEVTDVGTAIAEGYQVTWTVVTATGMPIEVFKVRFADNVYVGVIAASDLLFPSVRTAGQAFYRQSTVTATFDTLPEAQAARVTAREHLQLLVDAYNAGLATFLTTATTSYT